jgi:peptidoglycan/LPS O-acetylase OafA/YrhL
VKLAYSLADKFRDAGGRPSGFDYLRICLSVLVIAWHTIPVTRGSAAEALIWTGPLRPLEYSIVPCFFALSGFLVAGSLDRNDLPSFLTLRAIRIFPALCVEVFISALLIGPLVTTYPIKQYAMDNQFHRYFLNILGDIHYHLPGVFTHNPDGSSVNIQLWTVPFELECYISIALLSLFGLHKNPRLFTIVLFIASIFTVALQTMNGFFPLNSRPPGHMLVLCFLFGVCIYNMREFIPFSRAAFASAIILSWITLSFKETIYLIPAPIAYFTIYIGLLNPPKIGLIRSADYSYGVYLYGFVVQQTVVFLIPHGPWWINLAVSLAVSGLFALMSWHIVELKVLGHKKSALKFVSTMKIYLLSVSPWKKSPSAT